MTRFNRRMYGAASVTVMLLAAAILYADVYVAPTTPAGAERSGRSLVTVGQAAIGVATEGTLTANIGVIPVYAFATGADVSGDCTGNRLVNLADYSHFRDCFGGPGGGLGANCECADVDGDLDVDLRDALRIVRKFSSAGP